MSTDRATSFQWPLLNFHAQRDATWKRINLVSYAFPLVTRSSVKFTLIVDSFIHYINQDVFAIVLKQSQKPVKVNAKLWLEDENGRKFGESTVENYVFNKIGDKFGIKQMGEQEENDLFEPLRDRNKTMFVCCELIDLDSSFVTPAELTQKFRQNNWLLYEEEIHDAIIKVGNKEFKVSKFPFISQSKIFKEMFLSNFKEGLANTIEIKDMSENTMLTLIKWLYAEQIEDLNTVEDWSTVEDLFAASDKYDIDVLKKTCAQHLFSSLNDDNAFQRLVLAVKHNDSKLKKASLDYVSKLSTPDWVKFMMSHEWIDFSGKFATLAKEVSDLVREKFNV